MKSSLTIMFCLFSRPTHNRYLEHDIIHMEQQLERVRNDLLDAATAAKSAEEARIEAEDREFNLRKNLEEALDALEEVSTKVSAIHLCLFLYKFGSCLLAISMSSSTFRRSQNQ